MTCPFDSQLPFYYPCSALLLDDDEMFLESLKKTLGREKAVFAFSSVPYAFKFLNSANTIAEDIFGLFSHFHGTLEPNVNAGDDVVVLKSSKMRQLAASPDKYKVTSVALIDQAMPNMTGLEFCKKIKETGVKTILLTGKFNDQESVNAFNNGLIDRFINKGDCDAKTKVKTMIAELHREYLLERMAPIAMAYNASHRHLIGDRITAELMKKVHGVFAFSEYYYLPGASGFLLNDDQGNKNFLLFDLDSDQDELADMIADCVGECEVSKGIHAGDFICWNVFDDFSDDRFWTDRLSELVFPCHRHDKFRWALIPIADTPYREEFGDIAWNTYRSRLRSMPLNYVA